MSDELKPCPFCGSNAKIHKSKYDGGDWIECENRECIGNSIVGIRSQWQSRPLEDALRAQLQIAVEAFEKLLSSSFYQPDAQDVADEALRQIKE